MNRRIALISGLALLLLVATAAESIAHKVKYDSIAEISGYTTVPPFTFLGGVGSFDEKKCRRNRKVTVWKENPGAMDGPIGTTKTDKQGGWTLVLGSPAPPGAYYATAKKKTLERSGGHKHVCRGDRSPKFGIP